MKTYNRTTKRWEETTGQGKFKPRETCKGGREHDFIVCLPSWVKVTDDVVPELIEEYYASEKRRADFEHAEDEKLAALGLRGNRWSPKTTTKHMRCTVCDKRKYQK